MINCSLAVGLSETQNPQELLAEDHMIAVGQPLRVTKRLRLKSIALPVEHGGWSLLLEPVVLGLLLAPSLSGVLLSAGAVALFLARHPFKLAANDWRKSRRGPRTIFAERFAVFYLLLAMLTVAAAVIIGSVEFLLPLALAIPIAVIQLVLDAVGRSRSLAAELAGSIATGSLATAIAISGGWPRPTAFALWVIMSARSVPTVLYVRARLRLMRQKPSSPGLPITAHVAASLAIVALSALKVSSWLAALAIFVLLLRAIVGFWSPGKQTTPKELGVSELGFGVLVVVAVIAGNWVGL